MTIEVKADDEFLLLLQLPNEGQVDGYFYVEKGENVGFEILGTSLIYRSEGEGKPGLGRVTSDRFSFAADEKEGNTYTLAFNNAPPNTDVGTQVTLFLELIYPELGSMYVPLVVK